MIISCFPIGHSKSTMKLTCRQKNLCIQGMHGTGQDCAISPKSTFDVLDQEIGLVSDGLDSYLCSTNAFCMARHCGFNCNMDT